jgi:phosphoserine phosphatase
VSAKNEYNRKNHRKIMEKQPICVDLDGTIIKNDVTWLATKVFCKCCFFNFVKVILWRILGGHAFCKNQIALCFEDCLELLTPSIIYNFDFLEYICLKKKEEGRKLFLVTASNQIFANAIANSLQLFDGVFASNTIIDLNGYAKARLLTDMFGEKGFIYAGNSVNDVPVWDKCSECILVSPTKGALRKMKGRKYLLFNGKDDVKYVQ